ncbi:hypothetical protein [Pseudoscardovia radai]|uniref:hypothetical protein n=1 Tax=Pseudoscardovia radai TaxID=987066 RepID=UPI0039964CB0
MSEALQAGLAGFESSFPSSTLERARDYWRRGLVEPAKDDAGDGDTRRIIVHRADLAYTVEVTAGADGPSATCTCADDTTHGLATSESSASKAAGAGAAPCRHIAAAYYLLRDGEPPEHTAPEAVQAARDLATTRMADIPHEMYDGLLEAIVAKHDSSSLEGTGPESFTLIWTTAWADTAADEAPSTAKPLFSKTKAERILKDALTDFTTPGPDQTSEQKAEQMRSVPLDNDCPLFATVGSVVDNALHSSDWLNATRNLCTAVRFLCEVSEIFNDTKGAARSHVHALMLPISRYMTWMSEEAAPDVSGRALDMLTTLGCNKLVMHIMSGGIPIFSCALPFARWDDTNMWAYDMLEKADAALGTDTSEEACRERGFDIGWSRERLAIVRHDVAALSHDSAALETLRSTNPTDVNLQTIDLASAVLTSDVDAAREVLSAINKENQPSVELTRKANQSLLMSLNIAQNSELGMSGWLGMTEAVIQMGHDTEALKQLYTNNIANATVKLGIRYVPRMHQLVGNDAWPTTLAELKRVCGRQLVQRHAMLDNVNQQLAQQKKKPVPPVALRNPAYELLIIESRDSDEALAYVRTTGAVSKELLDIIGLRHPDDAVDISNKLQEAQKARGEKPTNLIDSKEYDLIAESDAAQDAVDAIIHPRKH